jgi:adenine-specific DNA-methyltransferase
MRHHATKAEDALWQRLRNGQIDGFRFRRQYAIDRFIVDFYCAPAKLAVEVDGPVHELQVLADAERTALPEDRGIRILRFENDQVIQDTEGVLTSIREALSASQPRSPSQFTERGKRQQGVRSNTPQPTKRGRR